MAGVPAEDWDADVWQALDEGRSCMLNDRLRDALAGRDAALLSELLPDVIGVMLHHPGLAGPFLNFNGALLSRPSLPERLRELVILRVLWRTGAGKEWEAHERMAARCGIAADEVEAVKVGAEGRAWAPVEVALLDAADQLLDRYSVDEKTWRLLAEHLDRPQLVELPFVVGTYTCLTMAVNSYGLGAEPDPVTISAT